MLDRHLAFARRETAVHLEQAARIGRDDQVRRGVQQPIYLALLQLPRLFRVGDVVDAGAAAAESGLVDLYQLHAGNRRSKSRGCRLTRCACIR